jgi:hypothetical protein
LKQDNEFTPDAIRHWNFNRYYRKLNNLSKVLIAAGEWESPGIVGLSEVENDMVLAELIRRTPLKKFDYSFVHYDSPDERGLDVALLYRHEILKVLYSKPFRIKFPFDSLHKTRDILYVKGLIINRDTIHLFVNHWPSRREGKEESDQRRAYAASVLKSKADSIKSINNNAYIIIMGDFNDEPSDKSISQILSAKCDTSNLTKSDLYNLMCENKISGEWTYFYKYLFMRQKLLIDQFIVSSNLLHTTGKYYIDKRKGYIFKPDWILKTDKEGDNKPFSTYTGPHYNGGFSDHLPVYIDLHFGK